MNLTATLRARPLAAGSLGALVALLALETLPRAAGAQPAQSPRQDGQWEVKIEMSMAGLDLPPQTTTQCVTPEQVKNQAGDTLPALPGGGSCKKSDYLVTGSRVTFKLTCDGVLPLTGVSELNYAGDTYAGTFKADLGGQALTVKYAGKRLGDCKN